MTEDRIIEAIEPTPAFRGLLRAEIASVLDAGEIRRVSAGEVILRRGEADDTMLGVLSGEVELTDEREGKERTVLATVCAGSGLGEVALFRDGKRRVSVCATQPTELFLLSRAAFTRLVKEQNLAAFKLGLNVASVLAEHVCQVQGSFENPCRCGIDATQTNELAHFRDVVLTQWGL